MNFIPPKFIYGKTVFSQLRARFWRTIKQEDIYSKAYEDGIKLWNNFVKQAQRELAHYAERRNCREKFKGLKAYFTFYNERRFHETLNNSTPKEIYYKFAA